MCWTMMMMVFSLVRASLCGETCAFRQESVSESCRPLVADHVPLPQCLRDVLQAVAPPCSWYRTGKTGISRGHLQFREDRASGGSHHGWRCLAVNTTVPRHHSWHRHGFAINPVSTRTRIVVRSFELLVARTLTSNLFFFI